MISLRSDAQGLARHFRLDPTAYRDFPRQTLVALASLMTATDGATKLAARPRVDPVQRAARLRAQLLQRC